VKGERNVVAGWYQIGRKEESWRRAIATWSDLNPLLSGCMSIDAVDVEIREYLDTTIVESEI
jgi:hypothetical protein